MDTGTLWPRDFRTRSALTRDCSIQFRFMRLPIMGEHLDHFQAMVQLDVSSSHEHGKKIAIKAQAGHRGTVTVPRCTVPVRPIGVVFMNIGAVEYGLDGSMVASNSAIQNTNRYCG